jgi:hypothetical protein
MPVDKILHVHPAARAGSSQPNLLPFGIDNVTAADVKELHLVIPLIPVRCWCAGCLFRFACRSRSRECCRTGKRSKLKKLSPWLQIGSLLCHKTSFRELGLAVNNRGRRERATVTIPD